MAWQEEQQQEEEDRTACEVRGTRHEVVHQHRIKGERDSKQQGVVGD